MKWWMHWGVHFAMARVPGLPKLHHALQNRFGEHADLVTSDRFDHGEFYAKWIRQLMPEVETPHVVELGTGWIPAVPLSLLAGGMRCDTYDVDRHPNEDLVTRAQQAVIARADRLSEAALVSPESIRERMSKIDGITDLSAACRALGGNYDAPVDTRSLPYEHNSVDVVVSNLVLSCIPKDILDEVIAESFRILRPGGHAIHRIWMACEHARNDDGCNPLHYLRFSDETWDRWFNNRLRHINRLRVTQFGDVFACAGFEVHTWNEGVDKQSLPYVEQMRVADSFQGIATEKLATVSLECVLTKPVSSNVPASSCGTLVPSGVAG